MAKLTAKLPACGTELTTKLPTRMTELTARPPLRRGSIKSETQGSAAGLALKATPTLNARRLAYGARHRWPMLVRAKVGEHCNAKAMFRDAVAKRPRQGFVAILVGR